MIKINRKIKPAKIIFISTLAMVASLGLRRSLENQIELKLIPQTAETVSLASCMMTCASTCGMTNKC